MMTTFLLEEARPTYCQGCYGNLLVLADVIEPKEHSERELPSAKAMKRKGLIKLTSKLSQFKNSSH